MPRTSLLNLSSPFWAAYKSALELLIPIRGKDLFVHPFTDPWIKTTPGKPLPEPVVNYLIYHLADTLLPTDTVTHGSTDGYAKQLSIYVNAIDKGPPPTEEDLEEIEEAMKRETEAGDKLKQYTADARRRYDRIQPPPSVSFEDWCTENAPNVGRAKEELDRATYVVTEAIERVYGKARRIEQHQRDIADALTTDKPTFFNMPTEQPTNANNSFYAPLYFAQGFRTDLNNWIKGGSGGPGAVFKATSIRSIGDNVDWFRLFHITGQDAKPQLIDIAGKEENISLEVTATGLGKFDITAGEWDVPNVKTQFPITNPPDVLNPKFARAFSVLVGYNIQFKVTVSGGFEDNVLNGTNVGEDISLYGISVSGGDGPEMLFNGGKSEHGDSVILTAVIAQPVILAILAQRLQ